MPEENQNPSTGQSSQDTSQNTEGLKNLSPEAIERLKRAEETLARFPDPAKESDDDDQEIEKLENESTNKIDQIMDKFLDKIGEEKT